MFVHWSPLELFSEAIRNVLIVSPARIVHPGVTSTGSLLCSHIFVSRQLAFEISALFLFHPFDMLLLFLRWREEVLYQRNGYGT